MLFWKFIEFNCTYGLIKPIKQEYFSIFISEFYFDPAFVVKPPCYNKNFSGRI